MSETEIRNLFALGAVVLAVLVAGYIIRIERNAADAGKIYSAWIYKNGLAEFNDIFFNEGVYSFLFLKCFAEMSMCNCCVTCFQQPDIINV